MESIFRIIKSSYAKEIGLKAIGRNSRGKDISSEKSSGTKCWDEGDLWEPEAF